MENQKMAYIVYGIYGPERKERTERFNNEEEAYKRFVQIVDELFNCGKHEDGAYHSSGWRLDDVGHTREECIRMRRCFVGVNEVHLIKSTTLLI